MLCSFFLEDAGGKHIRFLSLRIDLPFRSGMILKIAVFLIERLFLILRGRVQVLKETCE